MYITDQEGVRPDTLNGNASRVRGAIRQGNYGSIASPYRKVEQRDKGKQMNRMVMAPLQLLYLPKQQRLLLVLCVLILSLGCCWVVFPAFLGVVLLLPILLSTWLFGWRAGLVCFASVTFLLGITYGVAFGTTFWSSPWALPALTAMGCGLVLTLVIGVLRHMTNTLLSTQHILSRTEQAYQQAHMLNEMKDQVLNDLNHELRTPLTQIQGYLDLLELCLDQNDPELQARFIAQARSGSNELLSLINTALETAHASSASTPHLNTFTLRQEIQTVIADFEPQYLQHKRLHIDIPASLEVYADARFVRQVVRNLLTNACKYTPPQSPITVTAFSQTTIHASDKQANMICVQVQDRGPGIPPEQHALVFQRFVRLPNATQSRQPGTGLGLSICKQLVEAMGGRIWVDSTGRSGEGCCFSFTLAAEKSSAVQASNTSYDEYMTLLAQHLNAVNRHEFGNA